MATFTCKYFDEIANKYEDDEQHVAYDEWLQHMQLYFVATGTAQEAKKIAIYLLHGGERIAPKYAAVANDTLDLVAARVKEAFKPKNSKAYAKFKLSTCRQGKDETMEQYVAKLTRILKSANIVDIDEVEGLLLHQITVKCSSASLQTWILSAEAPTVTNIIKEAKLREAVQGEQRFMKYPSGSEFPAEINNTTTTIPPLQPDICTACGREHFHDRCPAANRPCFNCGEIGHFRDKCPRQGLARQTYNYGSINRGYSHPPHMNNVRPGFPHQQQQQLRPQRQTYRPMHSLNNHQYAYQNHATNHIQTQQRPIIDVQDEHRKEIERRRAYDEWYNQNSPTENNEEQPKEYFQCIDTRQETAPANTSDTLPTSLISVHGTKVEMLLDTGSTANLISCATYNKLSPKPTLIEYYGAAFGYAMSPINIIGQFDTTLTQVNGNSTKSRILVARHNCRDILGVIDCQKLGLINIVNNITASKTTLETSSMPATTAAIVTKFGEIFEDRVGKYNKRELRIHINYEVPPVVQKLRRVCFHQREAIALELAKLAALDIIEPVPADQPTTWVNNLVPIVKKDGSLRLCIDSKMANLAILTERYVMPTPDDIRFRLNGMTVISKLDLNRAYEQFVVSPLDRHIMVFATHVGMFQSKRLFFGLKSAAELFQKKLTEILRDITGSMNVSDDILVFGKDQEEHDHFLSLTLRAIKEAGLTLSLAKCRFSQSELTFFGMRFSGSGVRPTAERIKAFVDAPLPKTAGEVSSILSSVQFSAGFIKDLATIADPLRKLSHEKGKIVLTDVHLNALTEIKRRLAAESLGHFNVRWRTELETDASPVGLGAKLRQRSPEEVDKCHTVEYASRTLTAVERRWSQIEREMLAAVFGCVRFHLYLYGHPFTLFVDNKPLEMILRNVNSNPSARMEIMRMRLSPYDYRIKHIAGILNQADYVSRNPIDDPICVRVDEFSRSEEIEHTFNVVIQSSIPRAISTRELVEATKSDEFISKMVRLINDDKSVESDPSMKPFIAIANEFAVNDQGLMTRSDKCVVPKSLQTRVITLAHKGHAGVTKTTELIEQTLWFNELKSQVERFIKQCNCQVIVGTTHRNPLQMSSLPPRPMHSLAMDYKGPLFNIYILAIICLYSRYPFLFEVSTTSFRALEPKLTALFAQHGIPVVIKTDNGPPFNGAEFEDFCATRGIKHEKITPYHPNANGVAERFMPGISKTIKMAELEKDNWRSCLLDFALNYRATPHTTTGQPPATLFLGRRIRTMLPQLEVTLSNDLDQQVRKHDTEKKQAYKAYADMKRRVKEHVLQLVIASEFARRKSISSPQLLKPPRISSCTSKDQW